MRFLFVGTCFAFGFLQIPPRDGHPCRLANHFPCRADSGLSPSSHPAATIRTGTAPIGATRHTRRTIKKRESRSSPSSSNSGSHRSLLPNGITAYRVDSSKRVGIQPVALPTTQSFSSNTRSRSMRKLSTYTSATPLLLRSSRRIRKIRFR